MPTTITALTKINIIYGLKFLILLTLATFAPLLGIHSQWLTGPIVNVALILAVYLIGVRPAILIGILPSTIALSAGLLPAPLAPMIPFIILGNTLMILTVDWFKNENAYWSGIIFGAAGKFCLLFFTSNLVIHLLIQPVLAPAVSQMMSWPQFVTAILGGIIAWAVLKIGKINYVKN